MNAAIEPTDRSMWPATITSTMPIARIRMYPFCTIRFEMFCGRRRMPFVVIENSTTTAMSARKMPFLPRSLTMWARVGGSWKPGFFLAGVVTAVSDIIAASPGS